MSNGVIALLVAIGAAVWIYNRFMRYTGNQTQRSVIAATISGAVIFVILLVVFGLIF